MNKISIREVAKLGVGITLGYLAYKIINSRLSKKDLETNSPLQIDQYKRQQQQNAKQLQHLQQLRELLTHKSKNFEIETTQKNDQIFTKKCLLQFIAQTQDILQVNQILQIIVQNRKARRQVFPDIQLKYETYFRFVCTLDENIKYVLEKAQKDFAVFLNFDYNRIMESISYHIDSQQNQSHSKDFRLQVVEVMSGIRQNLANYLPLFGAPVQKNQLKDLIQFQTSLLQQKRQYLIQLVKKMGLQSKQQEQALPLFLTCYIQDSTWRQFNVQSQQMSISAEQMDIQIKQKFQRFKNTRQEVIKSMHFSIQDDIVIQ